MRRTLVVLALLLTLVVAEGPRILSVEEYVDVTRTPYNKVRIVLRGIAPDLMDEMSSPGVLSALCDQLSPVYTRTCDYEKYGDRVEFELVTIKDAVQIAGGFSPATLRPRLAVYHVPLSFLVADENEDVGSRFVRFDLPTFGMTVTEMVEKRDVRIEFPLACSDGSDSCWERTPLLTPADEYAVGDVITADIGEAELAVWALFDHSGAARSEVRVCFNCTTITLPVSYAEMGCAGFDHRMCPPQEMVLQAVVRRPGSDMFLNVTRTVLIRPAFFPVEVFLTKGGGRTEDTFFRGEGILVSTGFFTAVDHCEIEFRHEGEVVHSVRAPSCLQVPVVTGTSWPVGDYLVRVTVYNRHGFPAYGTSSMFLLSSGNDIPVPVTVEKPSYIAGEPVRLFINTRGERCEVELLNYTGLGTNTIIRRTFPCGNLRFDLPESILPGLYQLRVRVFRGEEHGVHLTTITVDPWRPRSERGTDLDRVCLDGLLQSKGLEVPCIGPGVTCYPRSDQHPVCLCFSDEGGVVDACGFNERCQDFGCAPMGGLPFTLIERDGVKTAQVGLQRIPFVTSWEICPAHCMCGDAANTFLHDCGPGELCTPAGCYVPQLVSRIVSTTPDHVRADSITMGEATVALEFMTRYKGKSVLTGVADEDLTLYIGDLEVPGSSLEVHRQDLQWRVEATIPRSFSNDLVPGRHPLHLIVRHEGEVSAQTSSLTVWYPTHESTFRAKLTSVDPETITRNELREGVFVQLYLSVLDEGGIPVTDLVRDDVTVTVEEGKAQLFSLHYVESLRQWIITVVIRGELTEGRRTLSLEVNRLGRRGTSTAFLTVVGAMRTVIDIEGSDPGSKAEPVYQILQRQGFDLDVMVTVRGDDVMADSTITGKVLDEDGQPLIDLGSPLYVASTQLGYRLHFSDARACDPPDGIEGWKRLQITFVVRGEATRSITAERAILFSRNPSGWAWDGACG